ncbi:uncharacterized protein LOC113279708 [Papaver somniferum]|uniref:uncharacterized protein LOC113279708 n=1 Tax=Papaver somniferum TaxID=3469 RepID=UPI000E700D85|nr:uncharacterized protein LOC113279708 [Papaver somniferum]
MEYYTVSLILHNLREFEYYQFSDVHFLIFYSIYLQNELHGRAALQWSICQDSLNRSAEARVMYEKLQSHPTVDVRKKAKQLNFGFEAMEMIKFKSTSLPINSGYQNYFDAFVEEKTGSVRAADEEEDNVALKQTIPYVIFLLAPLFIVFLLALRKAVSL